MDSLNTNGRLYRVSITITCENIPNVTSNTFISELYSRGCKAGGCLAAGRGFFHINTDGGVDPCPFSPFSYTNLKNSSLLDALQSALFRKLNNADILLGKHKGGCILFEKEQEAKMLYHTL